MTNPSANLTIPNHVAIVMDGNGRWAIARNKKRMQGHKAGMDVARQILEDCARAGVKVLTLFAFSSENWKRPEEEVSYLMRLFVEGLTRESKKLLENNIKIKVIGDRSRFPANLQKAITKAEQLTDHCDAMRLNIAANYGGRWDITEASRSICTAVQSGQLQLEEINEAVVHDHTQLSDVPDPDLYIRTGGEHRISNFLIWQLAYSELYFTDTFWPDFSKQELLEAFASFSQRQRRFGKTGLQIEQEVN